MNEHEHKSGAREYVEGLYIFCKFVRNYIKQEDQTSINKWSTIAEEAVRSLSDSEVQVRVNIRSI